MEYRRTIKSLEHDIKQMEERFSSDFELDPNILALIKLYGNMKKYLGEIQGVLLNG